MKVAIIHHALGRFGGAERLAILHAIHLNLAGVSADLYYNGPILDEWKNLVDEYSNCYELPFGLNISRNNFENIISTKKVLEKYDIVVFHHHVDPFMAFYLVKNLKTKTVWYCGEPLRALWEDRISGMSLRSLQKTVINTSKVCFGESITRIFLSDYLYTPIIDILRRIDIYTAKLYDVILTNSRYTKSLVRAIYGIHDNLNVVYPGIDVEKFESFYESNLNNPISSEDRYMLAVGAFIPMKNYGTLVESYSMLPKYLRGRCKLVIIGDGVLKKYIIEKARSIGIEDNLVIVNRVSDRELFEYYRYCDFVVHIALHEPFGLIPVEAGYFSKPAIVSNVGGTCEIVLDSRTGYTVNPKNPKEIRDKMIMLLEDDCLRRKLGRRARKRVLNEFTVEKSTKKLIISLRALV